MNTPTLGFQDDIQLTKRQIAEIQLTESIELFLAGKFLPSLTLAGAAEGILAGLVNDKREKSTAEKAVEAIERFRGKVKSPVMSGKSNDEIFAQWNLARNQVKHHGKKRNEEIITINPFDEAYWMIKRALSDAATIGVRIHNEQEFENWVVENINT